MAANQLTRSIPFMTLDSGCTITVEAIDPASGATVTGVTVSDVAIYATNQTPSVAPGDHDPAFTHAGSDT